MTYHISKIINGNSRKLHDGIPSHQHALDILQSMAAHYKRGRNKVNLLRWSLSVNDNEILYLIGE